MDSSGSSAWLYTIATVIFLWGVVILLQTLPRIHIEKESPPNRNAPISETQLTLEEKPSPSQHQRSSLNLTAGLEGGFGGINEVYLSRVPLGYKGSASWSTLLSVLHPHPIRLPIDSDDKMLLNATSSWSPKLMDSLVTKLQNPGDARSCIPISRATLMTLFAITNARPIISYSSASGHRSAYPSYCGQWSITWPIGKPCFVSLAAHDSHAAATDVYPPSFPVRVDKCLEMLAGIVTDGSRWKLAFPGRVKTRGPWALTTRKKGLAGAHGQRHLWNMVGGKVWEVDLLALEQREDVEESGKLRLEIPAVNGEPAIICVNQIERASLAKALDCLPWTSLPWSMHRGMRDILLAYGKPVMSHYRTRLASLIKQRSKEVGVFLVERGWNVDFVHDSLGSLAESSILAGGGNSGDLIRIVVAIVECLLESAHPDVPVDKDCTAFWTKVHKSESVDWNLDGLVALTKFLVLEWSQELDYQLYHELPVELYLA